MRRFKTNQSGIALMIVLAAITLLTAVATDFAYNTNVNYHLSVNEKERLQAYFLAESAINLMKLELKLERQFRSSMSNTAGAANIPGNFSGPLCQQFPLSTSLIRAMFLGQGPAAGSTGEGGTATGEESAGPTAAFISGLQVDAAKEFLNFEGDFDGECEDESAKINLNMFFAKNPQQESLSGQNDYDKSKQMLVNFFSRPEYKKLFGIEPDKKIKDIVKNIADWVDENDRMNEFGGTSTGSEESAYKTGPIDFKIKNNKFLSVDEMYLVADVADDWFLPLKDKFTVYGDDKVNVCLAPDEIIAALIVQYANSNPNITPINPLDREKMNNFVAAVKSGCTGVNPDVNEIAKNLDIALGIIESPQPGSATEPASPAAQPSPEAGTAGTAAGQSSFAGMITTASRYYTLIGTGIVGNTEVKIRAVVDTKDPQPSRWKYVYWKVE